MKNCAQATQQKHLWNIFNFLYVKGKYNNKALKCLQIILQT